MLTAPTTWNCPPPPPHHGSLLLNPLPRKEPPFRGWWVVGGTCVLAHLRPRDPLPQVDGRPGSMYLDLRRAGPVDRWLTPVGRAHGRKLWAAGSLHWSRGRQRGREDTCTADHTAHCCVPRTRCGACRRVCSRAPRGGVLGPQPGSLGRDL